MKITLNPIMAALLTAAASAASAAGVSFSDGQSHTINDGAIEELQNDNAVVVGNSNTALNILDDQISIKGLSKGIYAYNGGSVLAGGGSGASAEHILVDVDFAKSTGTQAAGLFAFGASHVGLDGVSIEIDAAAENFVAQAVYASGGSTIEVGSNATERLVLNASGKKGSDAPYGKMSMISAVYAEESGTSVTLSSSSIVLSAQASAGRAFTLFAQNGGQVSVGAAGSSVTLKTDADQREAGAVFAHAGGKVSITGKKVTIDSNGWYGIRAQNNTAEETAPGNTAAVIINAEHTIIDKHGYSSAITAFSNGYVEINGSLTSTTAPTLIDTRGHATINLNQKGDGTLQLAGDVLFETPGPAQQSGAELNAYVNINLNNAQSYWTGNVQKLYPTSFVGGENFDEWTDVSGFELRVANGAQWNVTNFVSDPPDGGVHASQAANLVALDGGIINASSAGQVIEIEDLHVGAGGGTFNSVAAVNADGTLSAAKISADAIQASSGSGTLSVNYGISSDFITAENASGLQGVDAANVGDGVTIVETAPEGDVNGAWTRENGSGAGRFAANTKLDSFRGVNAATLVQWRDQVNHITKRLGDLRGQNGGIGAWARVYGGESNWSDASRVEMDSTTVQVGGDFRTGDWILGGAFSYTSSDMDLSNGSGDGDMYGFAAYASRLFENGAYVDLIGRYGYIKNDMKAGNMDVDFDSNAFGLSAEIGHRFAFVERGYIEPQLELSYGYAAGDEARASNGVKIDQDDFQTLVARAGIRSGFDFPENAGTIYAHLSYSYDFLGDAEGTASKREAGGLTKAHLDEDLGGGWFTYGIGGQFRLGQTTFAYGELERTTGGEVEHPWQFSVGVRHLF